MDLSDALGDWPSGNQNKQNSSGGWPGQPTNPVWPGGSSQPTAPSGWPGGPSQPSQPTWPGAPTQPSQPTWPGAPTQPSQPTWPGAPAQPSQPAWPHVPSDPSQPSWPPGPPMPSQPSQPAQENLTLPFQRRFPQGLQDKKLITIKGTVKPNPDKITIDFRAGNDVVFHLNPRFNEDGRQVIVRNSLIGRRWGKEERELGRFPFAPRKNFEIKILVTSSCFKVAVDSAHLLEYKHRLPNLRAIDRMDITNDVTLSKVTVEDLH